MAERDERIIVSICPRCLCPADHSPDEKACSDNCITRHLATISRLRGELKDIRAKIAAALDEPDSSSIDERDLYSIAKSIQSFGNSVKFTSHERLQGRETMDDKWLMEVGERIIREADAILSLLREKS